MFFVTKQKIIVGFINFKSGQVKPFNAFTLVKKNSLKTVIVFKEEFGKCGLVLQFILVNKIFYFHF